MVRDATIDDIQSILSLGERMLTQTAYGAPLDRLTANRVLAKAVFDKTEKLLVAEHKGKVVGFMYGAVMPYWYSKKRYVTDMGFYVHEQHGNYAPGLIRRFVKWGKSQPGVIDVTLAISTGGERSDRAGLLYEKQGLTKVGTVHSVLIGEKKQ